MLKKHADKKPVLIVGAGVAGITAALDLARTGRKVHLVERGPVPGGQVSNLDKLYPTDHCAFCPLWTEIQACIFHPLINIHTLSYIVTVSGDDAGYQVIIGENPHLINESRCILCGRCVPKCGVDAIRLMGEHCYPASYYIDLDRCTRCGDCVDICPTRAIDITRTNSTKVLSVSDIIWATGFQDVDISALEEYGYKTHPDIMTSLEFEDWTAEAGVNQGRIMKKHDKLPPQNIAFIQCAGARDRRLFPYCSAVCCMHALKQAQWVKRRSPDIECVIFYTDMRTEGRHYYEYYQREIEGSAIRFIRGRPGLIFPLPHADGIAVKYEDTIIQRQEIRKFDMVVLNGALRPSLAGDDTLVYKPPLDEEGLVDLRLGATKSCGFCREPVDVETSVIQASSAALLTCMGGPDDGR